MLLFETGLLRVRKLSDPDADNLVKWLSDPVVLQYYGGRDRPHSLEMVRDIFYKAEDDETRCIVEYESKAIGYIQFYELGDEEKKRLGYTDIEARIYGMDQFIGEADHWNKGIGQALVSSMVDYLITSLGVSKIVMDPQAWNDRAIACYEKCGFEKVKLLPQHEWTEGELRDCWLMEFSRPNDPNRFEQFVRAMDTIPKKSLTIMIGIDGCGGAGKSTFANKVRETFSNVTIVHMDDFYLPSAQILNFHPTEKPIGADFDWVRLLNQVLNPLSQNKAGYYQRYDWATDALAEWQTVPVGGLVIIEGIYSIRKELADKYDFTIWVDCPRETRLSRGLERDGEAARLMWENNWMISEDIYLKKQRPFERASLIIAGTQ